MTTLPMNPMVKTVLGVLVGDVIFAGSAALLLYLARVDPNSPVTAGFILFSILYGIAFALLGGFVAGHIARRQDMIAGLLLAAIIAIPALFTLVNHRGQANMWLQISGLVLMAPAALIGDGLRQAKKQKR